MELDWRSIAGVVAPLAPKLGAVLGTALGGPLGTVIGGLAGNAIAAAFGTEATPEAVGKAIAEDPRAAEKLAKLDAQRGEEIIAQAQAEIARYEQEGLTKRTNVTEINTTLREEIAKGVSWWHWRHLLGYVVLLYGLIGAAGMAKVIFWPASGASAADLSTLFNSTTVFTGGIFALLGYVAADTTNRVNTAVTGEHSGGGVLNTIKTIATAGKKK